MACLLNDEYGTCDDRFCERTQALLHGDLHTGSIMVTQTSTKCIDPEFGFYGPMGFDVGAFLGNLMLAYVSQDGHATPKDDREVLNLLSRLRQKSSPSFLLVGVVKKSAGQ